MPIRLLLLTQWFDPEPTCKGLLFARELAKRGFEVEVVTGFPNYPGGRVYPGYRIKWIQREEIDGVRITRLPLYPSHDRSSVGRILNYFSFALAATIYGLFGAARPSVIYAYHPPLTVGLAAALIRIFRRVPLVLDVQDVWPDTLRATGMIRSQGLLSAVGWVCQFVYRAADRIVVLSPGFRGLIIDRGVPGSKIEVISNWADADALFQTPPPSAPHDFPKRNGDAFIVLFAGNLGIAQGLEAVIEAAALLQSSGECVEFVFLGAGLRLCALKALAKSRGLDNVHFLPPVAMSEVGPYLQAADALLVHLRKDKLFEITVPSKTQAYLAAGRPIIMGVAGDAARMILRAGGGVVAESGDPDSIASAVLQLMSMGVQRRNALAQAGRAYFLRELAVDVGVGRFAAIFSKLTNR